MHPKDTDGMANSGDPDQTTPFGAYVFTVCLDISVPVLWPADLVDLCSIPRGKNLVIVN